MKPEPRELTTEELYEMYLFQLAEAMSKFGGSFAQAIALAFYRADKQNRETLVNAFYDLFESYKPFIR
jgi:hypothetical protein